MRILLCIISFILSSVCLSGQIRSNVVLTQDSVRLGQSIDLIFKIICQNKKDIASLNLTNVDSVFVVYDPFAQSQEPDTVQNFTSIEINDYANWPVNQTAVSPDKLNWVSGPQGLLATIKLNGIIWQPGGFAIPPISVSPQNNLSVQYGEPGLLIVAPPQAYMPKDSTEVLADIKPIIEEPVKLEDFLVLIYGLISIVLLVIAFFLYKKYGQKEQEMTTLETEIIKRPAHIIANEKLDHLKSEKLWQSGNIKEYQSKLTFIIREYLENRYEVRALESTTQELLSVLKDHGFDKTLNASLSEILTMADLVKFAKAKPGESIHEMFMNKAYDLVNQTKIEEIDQVDE